MKHLFLLCVLFFLPSCGLYDSITKNSDRIGKFLEDVDLIIQETREQFSELRVMAETAVTKTKLLADNVKTGFLEAQTKADTDGDGETTLAEWLAYLAAISGVGGAAIWKRKRTVDQRQEDSLARNAKSDERKGKIESDVEMLKRLVPPALRETGPSG